MGILKRLREEMKTVESESKHNGYWYSISDVLILIVSGMLCGLQKIDDIYDWVESAPTRKFIDEQFGIKKVPCRAQIYNILKCVDSEKFKLSFIRWMQSILENSIDGKTIAIDGKTVCGTEKLTKDGSILNIVSAYVSDLKMVIGSHECASKPGERAAFRELLDLLDLTGAMVVADALHCNQPTTKAIIDAKADYLLVVKNNVPTLRAGIEELTQKDGVPSYITVEKNGGRLEKRTAYACNEIDGLKKGRGTWEKLSCVGAINREVEKNGIKTSEWHYYISSANLTPEQLLKHARLEWGVESMHWLLDVHYAEDKTRVWDMNVQKILNTTRKIALNLIRIFKSANHKESLPLNSVMKHNLFDLSRFADFLGFFRSRRKLD
jgi:predicted transposase YbfD/YdcC